MQFDLLEFYNIISYVSSRRKLKVFSFKLYTRASQQKNSSLSSSIGKSKQCLPFQNKWRILYCNVSSLLQFEIYVFILIPIKHCFWEIAVSSISLHNIPFLQENQNQSLYPFWTLAVLFEVFLDSSYIIIHLNPYSCCS